MNNLRVNFAAMSNPNINNTVNEAARAGQYGRGFAVVTDEVKNLVFTTKQAATEISEIMNADLENGTTQV